MQALRQPINEDNPLVFLDIYIGQEYAGRLVIELRADIVPKSAENFRALCTGELGVGTLGKPLHFKGSRFHKVTRLFVVQGGDIVNNDGTSGESIYGPTFEDENFILPHEEGVLSLVNYGTPNTNNSQFIITSVPCDNLNGTNVVFGRVLRGLGILGDLEQHTDEDSKPTEDLIIKNCGQILPGDDWGVNDNDSTEDSLPHYPQDWDQNIEELTSDEMVEFLMRMRSAGNYYYLLKNYYNSRRKYRKAIRYYQIFSARFVNQRGNPNNEDLKKLDECATLLFSNIAACEINLGEHINAIHACNEAIQMDPMCSKAYYRRGQCGIALCEFEEAIADLKHAHALTPNSEHIIYELNRARRLLAEHNRKQMMNLRGMFPNS